MLRYDQQTPPKATSGTNGTANGHSLAPDPQKPTPIDALLRRVSEWVSDREQVDESTRDSLAAVASSNTAKISLFRHVLGMKKAQRLTKLHAIIDKVEDKLYDPELLERIQNPSVLAWLLEQLGKTVKDESAYLERLTAPGAPGVDPAVQNMLRTMQVSEDHGERVAEIRKLDPQKRENVRRIFGKIARQAQRMYGT